MSIALTPADAAEPMTRDEAERITMRISLKLDSAADAWTGSLDLIREALQRDAYVALGYRSHGEYIAERFGGTLAKFGVEVRREVVRELTDAGLSTRAIAPIVGVSKDTVQRDIAGVSRDTPAPANVAGIDGKTYRKEPRRESRRKPIADVASDIACEITKINTRLRDLMADARFYSNAMIIAETFDEPMRQLSEIDAMLSDPTKWGQTKSTIPAKKNGPVLTTGPFAVTHER